MTFRPDALLPQENSQISDFRSIFTHQHPDAARIAALVKAAEGNVTEWFDSHQAPWRLLDSQQDHPWFEDAHKDLDAAMGGSVLLSLGAVTTPLEKVRINPPMKGIIHVDRYDYRLGSKEVPSDPYAIVKQAQPDGQPKQWWVKADMLDVVSRIPDNSVNVQLDGIDTVIIPNRSYHEALQKELIRILKPGGIIMGNNSEVLDRMPRTALEKVDWFFLRGTFYDARVFRKPVQD